MEEETMRSVTCTNCETVGWVTATPLKTRNFQKMKCKCGKTIRIFTRKWGKTLQFQ
jgi:hypothetical protein